MIVELVLLVFLSMKGGSKKKTPIRSKKKPSEIVSDRFFFGTGHPREDSPFRRPVPKKTLHDYLRSEGFHVERNVWLGRGPEGYMEPPFITSKKYFYRSCIFYVCGLKKTRLYGNQNIFWIKKSKKLVYMTSNKMRISDMYSFFCLEHFFLVTVQDLLILFFSFFFLWHHRKQKNRSISSYLWAGDFFFWNWKMLLEAITKKLWYRHIFFNCIPYYFY